MLVKKEKKAKWKHLYLRDGYSLHEYILQVHCALGTGLWVTVEYPEGFVGDKRREPWKHGSNKYQRTRKSRRKRANGSVSLEEERSTNAEKTTLSLWISLPLDGTHWKFGLVNRLTGSVHKGPWQSLLPFRTLNYWKMRPDLYDFTLYLTSLKHIYSTHEKVAVHPSPAMAVSLEQKCYNLRLTARWPLQGHYSFCLVTEFPAEIRRCHDVKSIVVSDVEIWDKAKHSFFWFYLFIFLAGHHFRRRITSG